MLAANRDEYYRRRTAPADFWGEILGGRDLEGGGTWMGITRTGRIAFLTNYRDPADNRQTPSRGELTSNYLQSTVHPKTYLKKLLPHGKEYKGFNLAVGNYDELWYFSNYGTDIQKLSPGVYGLSNHLLNSPWPKVERGLEKALPYFENPDSQRLLDLMYDSQQAPDEKLPNTGLSKEREKLLSSIFIKSSDYGTRCSTVIVIDENKKVNFTERIYNTCDFTFHDKNFEFQIE